jgi:hypothetical protein
MMVACRKSVSRATGASGAFDANEDNNKIQPSSQEKSLLFGRIFFIFRHFPRFIFPDPP